MEKANWIDGMKVVFHIREINWLILLWSIYFVPSMLIDIMIIVQRVMPYQTIFDVITPIEWFRIPLFPIYLSIAVYSVYRFVKNETDKSISIFTLINMLKNNRYY